MGMPAKKVSKLTTLIDPLSKVVGKITGKEAHELSDPLGLFTVPDAPDLEAIAPTQVMPIADEEALARARKRTAARKGAGRASTVLSLGSGGGKATVGG